MLYSKSVTFLFLLLPIVTLAQNDSLSTQDVKLETLMKVIKNAAASTQAVDDDYEGYEAEEFDKLILNETISRVGNEFVDLFNGMWSWPSNTKGTFSILLSERPAPRSNATMMFVKVNDQQVFYSFLQPRYDRIEEAAKRAVAQTYRYVLNYERYIKQLESDDMEGTGIY